MKGPGGALFNISKKNVGNRSSITKHKENIQWKRIVFLKKKHLFPELFVSRNVGNSIKCNKNISPPPPPQTTPTCEIKNQNKGIEKNYGVLGLFCAHCLG